jgi:hypothetical protein
MARTRVVLRRNGSKVGEVTYASESEAVAHAAKMQGAASGLEALLAPATGAKPNRKPRKNGVVLWTPHGSAYESSAPTQWASVEVESRDGKTYSVVAYGYANGQEIRSVEAFGYKTPEKAYEVADATRRKLRIQHMNPSIGRGTAHRDRVEAAIERRLHAQGEPTASARSRAYAIATAAELRKNPTPIDVASLDFAGFKRTTVIKGYYNVRTGRRFARVASKDGTFITDVPVKDGTPGESGTRGADAIKKRAYEQLRIHIQPTTWKPSVRVNPGHAGSVRYGGSAIRIADGTYTVQPHGPVFNGPDGFVAAKKWIDTHGA